MGGAVGGRGGGGWGLRDGGSEDVIVLWVFLFLEVGFDFIGFDILCFSLFLFVLVFR